MKNTEFTMIFKALRTREELSLRELSDRFNLSATYLYDLEKGNREPNEKIVESMIQIYQLDENQKRILYDAVARSTDSLPFDVVRYLKNNQDELNKIISNMERTTSKKM